MIYGSATTTGASAATLELDVSFGRSQESIDRGCTDPQESVVHRLLHNLQSSLVSEVWENLTDEGHETLAAQAVCESLELLQGIEEGSLTVVPLAVPLGTNVPCITRDENDALAANNAHLVLAAVAKHKCCVASTVAGKMSKLIQNSASLVLRLLLVRPGQFSHNGMSFSHCKPHGDLPRYYREGPFYLFDLE